jgi:hypothetical protein
MGMFASLRVLLSGIIDYAGLFPPAALPLGQAIRNYAQYHQQPENWMLGRFVCPVTQFDDCAPFVEALFDESSPFRFSALGRGGNNANLFQNTLLNDWEAITRFREQHGRRVVGDVYEGRLPEMPMHEFLALSNLLRIAFENACFTNGACYFEAVFGAEWRVQLASVLSALKKIPLLGPPPDCARNPLTGFKLRCGGLHASAFPSPEQVALVIASCRDAKVPLKFTAGLHHPLWHFDAGLQTHMHGFINVFVAGVLAHARGLSEDKLRPIIEDEDRQNFNFDDAGLRWKDHHATTDEIIAARRMVTSFGSCSFDEPRDDLRALGWLP